MLVMDENRLLGSDPLHLKWLEEFVRRDRNHPSVVIWSLANEEFTVQGTPAGGRVATTMQDLVKRLDPTRPVTYNAPVGNEFPGINEVVEVRGWSYHIGTNNMDAYHAAHPNQPNVGSEQGSTVSTRGIYTNDAARGYVSAYDDNAQNWSNTAENGGVSSTRVPGSPAASSGRGLITAANRRPMAGRASIRISASWTRAAFARTTPGIIRRGGRTSRCCICCRTGTGRAGKARKWTCAR